jgi:4-hydroxythreonine-4-phosphate dehydrogenase
MAINKKLRIVITSGDQDGIGPEVCAKALAKIGPQKDVQFYLWRSPNFGRRWLQTIDRKFKRSSVASWPEALRVAPSKKLLVDIVSTAPPPAWVEASANAGMLKTIHALVTAPLSKTLIADSGFKDLGHTDILSRVSGKKDLFMTFLGSHFHVLLATGHVPISQIASHLNAKRLELALSAAHHLCSHLKTKSTKPRIALLGLNPHAGEEGLIGQEELQFFRPLMEKLSAASFPVFGPLVPDAAFTKTNIKKYDFFVTPYHDQGLIPFKMVHEHSGCHLTMGLPFVRTSVDHGTAKDLFGKNKANSTSMQEALKRAIVLSRLAFKPDSF